MSAEYIFQKVQCHWEKKHIYIIVDYIILEPLQIIDKIKDYKCLAKHGKINLCRKPVVLTILDKAPC